MRAVVCNRYGPPRVLRLKDVETPLPGNDEVLIKVRATTVTSTDCNMRNLTFVPWFFRLPARLFMVGALRPRVRVLGVDVAGEIAAVGRRVTRFDVGEPVFGTPGTAGGAHADYLCMEEDGVLTRKPANMSWEEAASVPLAANTALHFIRDLGDVQAGQKVLINGASGGIGTFAVQLATYYGAEVTGVCSTRNVDLVRSLGAERVIDYTREDIAGAGEAYDVIFDAVGKLRFARCKGCLARDGRYLVTLPTPDVLRYSERVTLGDVKPTTENLAFLRELIEAGHLRTVIDRRYRLEEIVEAFRYVEKGHKRGNVVITLDGNSG